MKTNNYIQLAMRIDRNITDQYYLCHILKSHEFLDLFRPEPHQKEDDSSAWFSTSNRYVETDESNRRGNELRILALLFMHEMSKD